MFDNINEALKLRKDYSKVYVLATVIKNVDPLNKDRIQVHSPGLYEPDKGEVPWVGPADKPSPFGQSTNWGFFGSPAVGSDVYLELQDGSPNYPLYHSIQRFKSPDEFVSGSTWGFKDPKGNVLKFDLSSGQILLRAASGVTLEITPDGGVKLTAASTVEAKAPNFIFRGDVDTYGKLHNNDIDVGSGHRHQKVRTGNDISGTPI